MIEAASANSRFIRSTQIDQFGKLRIEVGVRFESLDVHRDIMGRDPPFKLGEYDAVLNINYIDRGYFTSQELLRLESTGRKCG